MKLKLLRMLALAGLLAGCSTVRDARRAQGERGADLPAGERTVTAEALGLGPGATLPLAAALDIALAWHPSIAIATQGVVAAEIGISRAGAGLRPSLSASGGYSESHNANSRNDWKVTSSDSFNASLSLSWVLYDFGRTRAARKEAVAGLIAAHASLQDTLIQRTYQVRAAYFDVAQAQAQCAVAEENLRQYDELLRRAEARLRIGAGIPYNVTKARVDRSNALLSLVVASNAIDTACATLNSQMGLAEAARYELDASITLPEVEGGFEELRAVAWTNHPTLKVLHAKADAASFAVDRAIAELYPQIAANASTSFTEATPQTWAFSWGASLLQDLFKGWQKRDNIRASVTALRQARAAVAMQEQQTALALASALIALNTARESKAVAEQMEAQAKENLDLVKRLFEVGDISILELTDAQVLHASARNASVTAQYALEKSKAMLYSIMGTQ
ncbi:MAG: TolC family protein [Kiritimatiellaeota bacterium]|nr:TolC family protein [Kiritimatiellota bacterium]